MQLIIVEFGAAPISLATCKLNVGHPLINGHRNENLWDQQ